MPQKTSTTQLSPMLWISALQPGKQNIEAGNIGYYAYDWITESELFGEELNLENVIKFKRIGKVVNTKHLHICRLSVPRNPPEYDWDNATKDGYNFKGKLPDEIIYLLSVFLQSRFHLLSTEELPFGLTKIQYELPSVNPNSGYWEFLTKQPPDRYFRTLENSKEYFTLIKQLAPKQQKSFILSCQNFHNALRSLDDPEKHEDVVINLIKSIEPLSKEYPIDDVVDIISSIIKKLEITSDFEDKEKELIQNLIERMKSQQKFIAFIKHYSEGFFSTVPKNRSKVQISREQIDDVLKQLYDARSRYVHEGEPMYFSLNHKNRYDWDWHKDASVGAIIHQRKLKGALPYLDWQIRLVRHCLLSYIGVLMKNN